MLINMHNFDYALVLSLMYILAGCCISPAVENFVDQAFGTNILHVEFEWYLQRHR